MQMWMGAAPRLCDLCRKRITNAFVDGRTYTGSVRGLPGGRWTCMCLGCHAKHGTGLGQANGQQYERREVPAENGPQGSGGVRLAWVKVQG